ncbi:hypothetical protein I302_107060 [Kwoniella bestiolae CBS 10118]|uniref:Uncharacterized protein n=1 Tax=Kwoniella bestiolae CBS 10118 TaxID=1296100 RepID=A0A1B9FZM0_9TREE|nr:hypothetical protein I302_05675 [Kwoniella bestiolae CBS 10118]OCF24216.1 hypothetical protein I302_05675 [Kwoniella bestiolae CBS 10118]
MTFTPFLIRSNPHERWISGCQAIFAGFVARATDLKIQPTIRNFWTTDQHALLIPSLRDIERSQSSTADQVPKGDLSASEDQDRDLQNTLFGLLNSSQNKFTEPSTTAAGQSDPLDQSWKLTKAGKQTFHLLPNPTTSTDLIGGSSTRFIT